MGIEEELFRVEWLNTLTRQRAAGEPIKGGGTRHFTSPFGLESLLYLQYID